MMKIICIGMLLMLMVVCSGCMGINAPAMPKIQPLAVNIEKNNAQLIDRAAPTPTPTTNITTIPTTNPKIVFV